MTHLQGEEPRPQLASAARFHRLRVSTAFFVHVFVMVRRNVYLCKQRLMSV
jgi:hypothetical protein